MEATTNYPKFIDNSPCGEDLFEGKSQQNIANNIRNIIKGEKNCNIIGIDGGWGSGKSNLVKQIQNMLTPEGYHFFIYDAWGHQEDLQRRSFLEELTENLTQENLVKETWKPKLDQLLAKAKKTESKRTPKLSLGVIVAGLAILITPLFKSIADKIEKLNKIPHHYLLSLTVLSIPLLSVIGLFVYFFFQEEKGTKKEKLKNAFTRLFLEYQNKLEEETKYEMISEEEPSVRKFRNWMTEISQDLINKKLVLVFDNMDRLPQKKVQELWSSIHVFFCENSYDNIKVIVPFDREHIKLAFKSEDIDKKQYGDDFINKTFSVVYRVSPPILSDWKTYFYTQWKKAFGEEDSLGNSSNVLQIFDLLNDEITPRKIIAFINEFVSIKLTVKNSIPNKYIALFILGKYAITKKPIDEIINPTYLKGLAYLYQNDDELPKYIAALFYQVEPEKAIQIVFTDKIKKTLNENDVNNLEKISSLPEFYHVLENAIPSVDNFGNAILALSKLPEEKIGSREKQEVIWDCLYKKVVPRQNSTVSDFQLVLLSKVKNSKEYLRTILNELPEDPQFSSINYFKSINRILQVVTDESDVFNQIRTVKTSVEDFISFVRVSKSEYKKYNIGTDEKTLNEYLSQLEILKLKDVDVLPYLKNDYSFKVFEKNLEEMIRNCNADDDRIAIGILFSKYKEVSNNKPLTEKLDDATINVLFTNSQESEGFYYDLLAMRIAKLDQFDSDYDDVFEKHLQSLDPSLIEKVSATIENFIDYDDLLLGLKKVKECPIVPAIAKYLTHNFNSSSRAEIDKLIQNFEQICLDANLEPNIFLRRLDNLDSSLSEEITKDNVKSIANPFFIEKAINEDLSICKNCIVKVTQYLDSLSNDQWKDAFKNLKSYEVVVAKIIDYKFSTNAFEAFKDIIKDVATGVLPIPDRKIVSDLIAKLENQGRSLKAAFNNVRDSVCAANSMTPPIFKFLGTFLFQHANLEKNQSSLRTIFNADIVRDNECMTIILSHQNKMPAIIQAADEEAKDFIDVIKDRLSNDQSDNFLEFAKTIGIQDLKIQNKVEDETKLK